eukprot:3925745-Rhodomonas_salina.9
MPSTAYQTPVLACYASSDMIYPAKNFSRFGTDVLSLVLGASRETFAGTSHVSVLTQHGASRNFWRAGTDFVRGEQELLERTSGIKALLKRNVDHCATTIDTFKATIMRLARDLDSKKALKMRRNGASMLSMVVGGNSTPMAQVRTLPYTLDPRPLDLRP